MQKGVFNLVTGKQEVESDTQVGTTNIGIPSDSANTDATTNGSLIAFIKGLVSEANNNLDSFHIVKASPTAFDGATTNARGDEGGTSDPKTLFTVTGDVLMAVYGVCTVDLVGSGSVSVGPAGNAALMIPVTVATLIDEHELWMDGSPAIGKPIDSLNFFLVGNGVDIVEDVTVNTITAGNIYYVCLWKKISSDGNVVAV